MNTLLALWVVTGQIGVIEPTIIDGAANNIVIFQNKVNNNPTWIVDEHLNWIENGMPAKPYAWHTVNISSLIPVDKKAKAVFLEGLLIITHGNNQETCNLTVTLRNPDSNIRPIDYQWQTIEASAQNGQRSVVASWVSLEDQKFEWSWSYGDWLTGTYPLGPSSHWPDTCAYGLVVRATAFVY